MERRKRRFTQDFRDQAVKLAKELGSNTQAGQQLGVNESLIRAWFKRAKKVSELRTEGSNFSVEEFRRLQKENERLKKVNQILKAAAAVFSQDHFK